MYDVRDEIYYSIIKQFLILHQIDMAVTPMDFLGFFVENHGKFREDPKGNGELEIYHFLVQYYEAVRATIHWCDCHIDSMKN